VEGCRCGSRRRYRSGVLAGSGNGRARTKLDRGPIRHPPTRISSTSERRDVAGRLLPAPDHCRGPSPKPRIVAPAYGKLIGFKPLWAGFYAAYQQERQAFRAADAPRKPYGFRIKVLWIMSPGQEGQVNITGTNLGNGRPMYFRVEDLAQQATTASLDPSANESPPTDHWREFPSYMYFDGAGCFELEAPWDTSSWRIVFGFGR
jgi:hypothetical protein